MADADTTMYICSKCKLEQPPENFHRNNRIVSTGRRAQCKGCIAKNEKLARVLKKTCPKLPKPSFPEGYKRCPRCEEIKVTASFGPDRVRPDGLKCWCKKCHSASDRERWKNDAGSRLKTTTRNKKWIKLHPEKNTEYMARWRKLNPDAAIAVTQAYRARKRSAEGKYTAEDVQAIHAMQKGKCAYCKARLAGRYDVDHIIPLSRGGSNLRTNLQLTCKSCNCRKHAQDPIDYARQLGRLL